MPPKRADLPKHANRLLPLLCALPEEAQCALLALLRWQQSTDGDLGIEPATAAQPVSTVSQPASTADVVEVASASLTRTQPGTVPEPKTVTLVAIPPEEWQRVLRELSWLRRKLEELEGTTGSPLELLTTIQAAELVGRQPRTLEDWRRKGVGPAYLPGSPVLYRREDVESWLHERKIGGE